MEPFSWTVLVMTQTFLVWAVTVLLWWWRWKRVNTTDNGAATKRSLGSHQSFGVDGDMQLLSKWSERPESTCEDTKSAKVRPRVVSLKSVVVKHGWSGTCRHLGIVSFTWRFYICVHIFAWRSSTSPLSCVLAHFDVPSKTNLEAYAYFSHFPGGLRLSH